MKYSKNWMNLAHFTIAIRESLHGMNPSNNDIPNLRQENNNNFKQILRQDKIPLDKQCKQLLDTYKTNISDQTDRNEHGFAMAAFSVAFSLFAFAIEKTLVQPTMFAGYNNNQKIPDPVIPWMLENSKFNTKLDTSMKFASTTSNEQKIYATSEKIITYVNGLHEHLTKIIHPILFNLISLQLGHNQKIGVLIQFDCYAL